jgi:hypothetical protein
VKLGGSSNLIYKTSHSLNTTLKKSHTQIILRYVSKQKWLTVIDPFKIKLILAKEKNALQLSNQTVADILEYT